MGAGKCKTLSIILDFACFYKLWIVEKTGRNGVKKMEKKALFFRLKRWIELLHQYINRS